VEVTGKAASPRKRAPKPVPAPPEPAEVDELREMFVFHRDLGRKAMQKAMQVLDQTLPEDIPVNVAVQLLKFGADLERRALLGIEPDEEHDPFDQLAKAMSDEGGPNGR
jgi:hypothetical protein